MGNNNKGSIILLTIISVATLLVAVVGATFAYFNISSIGTLSAGRVSFFCAEWIIPKMD